MRPCDPVRLGGYQIGLNQPLTLISGPCVIESRQFVFETAAAIVENLKGLPVQLIFKASYDKANRSAADSFRGPGLEQGLEILAEVREQTGVPVLTDVHSPDQATLAAQSVDVLQIPAFLSRQTDLIQAAAATGKVVNIKKGQFMAPDDMANVVEKATGAGGTGRILLCERGASFGYHNLVSDMRSLVIMRDTGCPVIFDATHSVQLPGAGGKSSGGERRFIGPLARAAVAVGVAGVFAETHPQPDKALSDGPNAWPLADLRALVEQLLTLRDGLDLAVEY